MRVSSCPEGLAIMEGTEHIEASPSSKNSLPKMGITFEIKRPVYVAASALVSLPSAEFYVHKNRNTWVSREVLPSS